MRSFVLENWDIFMAYYLDPDQTLTWIRIVTELGSLSVIYKYIAVKPTLRSFVLENWAMFNVYDILNLGIVSGPHPLLPLSISAFPISENFSLKFF